LTYLTPCLLPNLLCVLQFHPSLLILPSVLLAAGSVPTKLGKRPLASVLADVDRWLSKGNSGWGDMVKGESSCHRQCFAVPLAQSRGVALRANTLLRVGPGCLTSHYFLLVQAALNPLSCMLSWARPLLCQGSGSSRPRLISHSLASSPTTTQSLSASVARAAWWHSMLAKMSQTVRWPPKWTSSQVRGW
jgi:hypothetical protein